MTEALDRLPPVDQPVEAPAIVRAAARRDLASTEVLLSQGGDTRLTLDPVTGRSRYGCAAKPDPGAADFGSATASTISAGGFRAADGLRERLIEAGSREQTSVTYARELDRIRTELIGLCGLETLADLSVVFAASGTDLHLLVAELVAGSASATTVCIDIEPQETGSGVPAALGGRHFSGLTALGAPVSEGGPIGPGGTEFVALAAREADGRLRPAADVEADLDAVAHAAVKAGRRVLLVVSDVSKTGLISPGLDAVLALRRRFPRAVEVLIDACQFRLSPASLRAYLDHGFLVAVTGSKFLTGPTFSGALLVPAEAGERLRGRLLRPGLKPYSARAEWPPDWVAGAALSPAANFGLLLRWEAALSELRAFRALPPAKVEAFVAAFAAAVSTRLENDPLFEPLPVRVLDRSAIGAGGSWDRLTTVFPFLIRHSGPLYDGYLSLAANQDVYRSLMSAPAPVRLGQPVLCGERVGRPISALRLCNSARVIVQGAANSQDVIDQALAALGAAAAVARAMSKVGRL